MNKWIDKNKDLLNENYFPFFVYLSIPISMPRPKTTSTKTNAIGTLFSEMNWFSMSPAAGAEPKPE